VKSKHVRKLLKGAYTDVAENLYGEASCHCGGVQFAVFVQPAQVLVDQSTACQRSTGAFEIPFAAFDRERLVWREWDTLKSHTGIEGQTRHFCGNCGALICMTYSGETRTIWVAAALLPSFRLPERGLPCSRIATEQKHSAADACRLLPERYDMGTYIPDPCGHPLQLPGTIPPPPKAAFLKVSG
jgi:hypothetical protein